MHYCGIIIKLKETSVVSARTMLGDVLIERGKSDWYSTDDYRERTFEGKKVISLDEFTKIFTEKWLTKPEDIEEIKPLYDINDWAFAVESDSGGWFDDVIIPSGFYEYYAWVPKEKEPTEEQAMMIEQRNIMLVAQAKAYYAATVRLLKHLEQYKDKYDVTLIDYHN